MKAAPVSEGRPAAARGESLSRFPHRRDSFVSVLVIELPAALDRAAASAERHSTCPRSTNTYDGSKVAVNRPGLAAERDTVGLRKVDLHSSVHIPTHLKPPIRGTVTSPVSHFAAAVSSVGRPEVTA